MGPFEQRGCAIRQAAPRCSNPTAAERVSDISNERKQRLVYRVLTNAIRIISIMELKHLLYQIVNVHFYHFRRRV